MKSSSKKQSILSLLLIFTLVIGAWAGTGVISWNRNTEATKKENVVQAGKKAEEFRAVWISYIDLQNAGISKLSKAKFEKKIGKMFDKCVNLKMNTVIVQVRPMGDAIYQSKYFPWSAIASGKQGKSPGYDPLKCMVSAAHKRGLSIHAWINPYRVTLSGTNVNSLSTNNYARKWKKSSSSSKRRNVLSLEGKLY